MEEHMGTREPETPVVGKQNGNEKWLKVATGIMAAVAVCGVGFGIYGIEKSALSEERVSELKVQIKNEDGTTTTLETNKIEINESPNTITISDSIIMDGDTEVKNLIEQISKNVDAALLNGAHLNKTFNEVMPRFKVDGINVDAEKSYGISSGDVRGASSSDVMALDGVAVAVLKENGFTKIEGVGMVDSTYYNTEKQIVCETSGASDPWTMGCAKTTWVSESRIQLARELYEASGLNYLNLNSVDITDSEVAPYQRMVVGGYAAHLFYRRKDGDGKWHYVTSTQGTSFVHRKG